MRKYWKRWLRLLLAGASGVAILIGLWLALSGITPGSIVTAETIQNGHLTLTVTPESSGTIQPDESAIFDFLLESTLADTVTFELNHNLSQAPSITLRGEQLGISTPYTVSPQVPLAIHVVTVAPDVASEEQFAITLSATSNSTPSISVSLTSTITVSRPIECNYDAKFVDDVTTGDDTRLEPGEPFVKTWRIRNTGDCAWEEGTKWVFISGERMDGFEVDVPPIEPDGITDISVNLIAPPTPGTYTGCWRMRWLNGEIVGSEFGNGCDIFHIAYVRIIVADATPPPTASDTATPLLIPTDTLPPTPVTDTPMPPPDNTNVPPPPPQTAATSTPSPSSNDDGPNLFIILGFIGLVGLLGIVTIGLLWRRSRAPRTPLVPGLHPAQVPTQPFLTAPYLHSPHTTGGPRNFALNQPRILIGRDERAGICIDETFANWESVSREHAWIIRQGEQVIIEDNNSMNGITVNGRRTRRNLLKDGWRLEIGGVAFVFHAGREVAEPRQEHNTRSAQ